VICHELIDTLYLLELCNHDDLLDVTRLESGRLSIERERVSVSELVADCARAQMPLAARRSLALSFDVEPDLPDVSADRNRLLQVFENLVGNAVKFTPPGGSIALGAARAGEEVRFSVSDTGPGISEEYLPHLFDRFWQGTRERRHGAGLGLAIVKGIVETHGGRVWAESVPERGATFCFTIPIASPVTAAAHDPAVAGDSRPSFG
jgi:signal transduction histidine kinase